MTVWVPVIDYEDNYEVSSDGEIRRILTQNKRVKNSILYPDRSARYDRVTLSKKNLKKRFSVHRVVCTAFHGACPPGKEVNHIDGNKRNNSASNLEWVTRQEQHWHRFNVLGQKSSRRGKHLNPDQLLKIRTLRDLRWPKDKFGVCAHTKSSRAAFLYEKGATSIEVAEKLGQPCLSVLTQLSKRGHQVERLPNKIIKLTHKDELAPHSRVRISV